jgi:hypothetical protein
MRRRETRLDEAGILASPRKVTVNILPLVERLYSVVFLFIFFSFLSLFEHHA